MLETFVLVEDVAFDDVEDVAAFDDVEEVAD